MQITLYVDKLIINTNGQDFNLDNLFSGVTKEEPNIAPISSEKNEVDNMEKLKENLLKIAEENKENIVDNKSNNSNNVVSMAQFKKRKTSKKRSTFSIKRKELFLEVMKELTKQPSDCFKKSTIMTEINSKIYDNKYLRDKITQSYYLEGVMENAGLHWDPTIDDPNAHNPESLNSVRIMAKLCLDTYLEMYDACGNLSFLLDDKNLDDETRENYYKGYNLLYSCVDYVFSQDIKTLIEDGKIKKVNYSVYALV